MIEGRLGYTFSRPELLECALTHSSFASGTRPDNERLEFLGDRVLGLAMADALMRGDPEANEGLLAQRFNVLVCRETCAEVAGEIGLGSALRLSRSEMQTGGQRNQTLQGDALEAVIAAVFLDGGFVAARDVVLRLWGERLERVDMMGGRDSKSALQNWALARGLGLPCYRELKRNGPDHALVFTMAVQVGSGEAAQAEAASKRRAEQAAAERLLTELEKRAG